MDADNLEEVMLSVLDYYDIPVRGTGERTVKCPVHDDTVASASVNVGKGLFHCHACGAGGTAINIVMEREHLTYHDAVKFTEEKIGKKINTTRATTRARTKSSKRWTPPSLRRGA
jgi:DNA primase